MPSSMKIKQLLAALTVLSTCICLNVYADESISNSVLTDSDLSHAAQWQLTDTEYRRYQKILKSSRAYFTPGLDKNPLLALALESESDAERRRYADKWVQIQFENNIKVILWQFEVNDAWQRQFPGVPLFAYKQSGSVPHAISSMRGTANGSLRRVNLYLSFDKCVGCDSAFEEQKRALERGEFSGVDVFFVEKDSPDNRRKIAEWALRMNMSPDEVKAKRYTLNFSDSTKGKVPHIEFN